SSKVLHPGARNRADIAWVNGHAIDGNRTRLRIDQANFMVAGIRYIDVAGAVHRCSSGQMQQRSSSWAAVAARRGRCSARSTLAGEGLNVAASRRNLAHHLIL